MFWRLVKYYITYYVVVFVFNIVFCISNAHSNSYENQLNLYCKTIRTKLNYIELI